MTALALPLTIADLVREHDEKVAGVREAIATFEAAHLVMRSATVVNGAYVDQVVGRCDIHEGAAVRNLRASGWRAAMDRLDIKRRATAADWRRIQASMSSPPPFTLDNVKATFRDYLERPRFHTLRGLAEAFCSLDNAYKSHSKVRIGVAGLPKRVILTNWDSWTGGYGRDRFVDLANALAAYQELPALEWAEIGWIQDRVRALQEAPLTARDHSEGVTAEPFRSPDRGMTLRPFRNGNVHVLFDAGALLDINRALAEFYGEVLPDVDDRAASEITAVARDLQFYWSPPSVVAAAIDFAGLRSCALVLEPSAGDGRIIAGLLANGHQVRGFEVDPARAAACRAAGMAVTTANFLEQPVEPIFDAVVMNPPFYGRHYAKHVRHALRFLRSGGVLVAILPATARYDHGELDGEWRDLPVASFADAGTNVPTTMLRVRVQ